MNDTLVTFDKIWTQLTILLTQLGGLEEKAGCVRRYLQELRKKLKSTHRIPYTTNTIRRKESEEK